MQDEMNIAGMEVIEVLRCSTDGQVKKSLPRQKSACKAYATSEKLTIVATTELGGLSATYGEQIDALLKLIHAKRDGTAHYDAMLLDSWSRLVRTEADGAKIYSECCEAELLIITVKDGLMMGPGTWAKRGSATDQSEGAGREISSNTNGGVTKRMEDKTIPTTVAFSYGVDRLYFDERNQPIFRVHKMVDGRKAVLNPHPPYDVQRYIAKSRIRLHLLEEDYRFEYVPSHTDDAAVAREILTELLTGRKRSYQMARHLNTRGIPSPTGKRWSTTQIDRLIEKPIYVGFAVGGVCYCGVHSRRQRGTPKLFAMPRRAGRRKDGKGKRKRIPIIYNPPDQWLIAEQPAMVGFIVNPVAREAAESEWKRKLAHGWKKPLKRSKAPTDLKARSRFFLSRRIFIKDDKYPMVGNGGTGKGGNRYRYYGTNRSHSKPVNGDFVEAITAEPVEEMFKDALREIFAMLPKSFDRQISSFIKEYSQDSRRVNVDTRKLLKEKAEIEEWYRANYSVAGNVGKRILDTERQRAEHRVEEIDGILRRSKVDVGNPDQDTAGVCRSVRAQLSRLGSMNIDNDYQLLHTLSSVFILKLTFDPPTGLVEGEFGLPLWAIRKEQVILDGVLTGITAETSDLSYQNTLVLVRKTLKKAE